MRTRAFFVLLTSMFISTSAFAQGNAQYRGFWVDTFNTTLNNHADVVAVVNNTKLSRCNAIFVQVRRRGDSWYLNSLEPIADRTPIQAGFDPLLDLITEAHANGIEVHAFVIIGAVWNGNPTGASARPPENPNHVFNKHGFNQATGKLYEGRDNWLARTLLPDDSTITFNGHRIGADFWIDLGHPDAAQYSFDVLMHLVRNYDLDGLHFDRIRYPDIPGTLAGGTSSGYNETNVARFQRRYGLTAGSAPPAPNDPRWSQWRRDQVTNFVRRVYLNSIAVKPRLKISGALIAYGSGPASESDWNNAEAYWRVFQDWRAWTEEGILDYAIPMDYKRDHVPAQQAQFDSWMEWTKNHAYDRGVMIGTGAYLNAIEGTLRQTRRPFAANAQGNRAAGVVFFSLANTNEAVTGNPLSIPAGQNTPKRSFVEFASALTTGKSADGATRYEETSDPPVFAASAALPAAPWKTNPVVGHLMGVIKNRIGDPIDTGEVLIARIADGTTPAKGRTSVTTATDGNGFYGGVDLAPGRYRVTISPVGETPYTPDCAVTVFEGQVSAFDLLLDRSTQSVVSVSAGSYCGPRLAPESIVAAFGSSLASGTQVANTLPLPTMLGSTGVMLKDIAGLERLAPLFFVSPAQVNYLIPKEAAFGPATVAVTNGNTTFTGSANIARVSPAIFTANTDGRGVPAAILLRVLNGGAQITEPVAQFNAMQNRFVVRPIDLGPEGDQAFLILFATGVRGRSSLANVTVRIGGMPAEVSYAGPQGSLAGLDQLNIRLPRNLAGRGDVEVVLLVENYVANVVQINVR
ncbi:MAG: family 10 glycosylhydrolase [Blastocatellia bacterium]